MKSAQAWRLGMKDIIMPAPRLRGPLRKPTWIIVLVSLVSLFLICAYVYPPQNSAACYVFSSRGCKGMPSWLPPSPIRELTDEEIAARVVIRDILDMPPAIQTTPKIAFLFLTPGALPFEKLWDKFFQGLPNVSMCGRLMHKNGFVRCNKEASSYLNWFKELTRVMKVDSLSTSMHQRINLYILAVTLSTGKFVAARCVSHFSVDLVHISLDNNKDVGWGKISMVDAERRLLGHALKDTGNQHFVLLSDSCIPLRDFDFVYNYLMYTNVSFVDSFEDPGQHGSGRYSENMLPEVEKRDFRKGAQWFTMKRQHAVIVMADNLYYSKFRDYCRQIPTSFQMLDPVGVANWSVTHVDWSEGKWHPKSYRALDVTYDLMRNITSSYDNNALYENIVTTLLLQPRLISPFQTVYTLQVKKGLKQVQVTPCLWNGNPRPCYLFARKFLPETLDNLIQLFPNYTSI
ncbi:hypothetical protein SASPL_150431 [Salvia splendens]|uniref:Uncharacterized protein n=1 Tax=Salvia splendens TaxID=180675 RepID=A0A8X8Z2N6_SALSN|nr:hypothetical protein SASPL_150431 [Salvia splendens]